MIVTKDNLVIALRLVKVKKNSLMETHIWVFMRMENLEALGNISGRMDQFIKENLKMVLDMVKVYGLEELVYLKDTRDNLNSIKRMVKEFSLGLTETDTKEAIKTTFVQVKVQCTGMMEVFTKVYGIMEFKMAKVKW